MTTVRPSVDLVATQPVRIQLLHVRDCPNVDELRLRVQDIVFRLGASATLEEIEGLYPSPTLTVNGVDVTGSSAGTDPSCRLDLPSEEQIRTALIRAADEQSGREVSSLDDALTSRSRPEVRHAHQHNFETRFTPETAS